MASMMPPRMPRLACGTRMWRTVWLRVRPSANPVRRREAGSPSSAVRVVTTSEGRTSRARQPPASRMPGLAPAMPRRCRNRMSVKPKIPMTMDGMPARMSIITPNRRFMEGEAYSAR